MAVFLRSGVSRFCALLITLMCSAVTQAGIYSDAANYARSSKQGEGAVATVHPLATEAGLQALEKGGNALDAAIAAALTLGVVDSHNSGIGNGNFVLVRFADGRALALDGREMAPSAAHRDMYLRDGKADASLSKTGALAIGVPGALAVYDYLLGHGARLSLAELILPAAELAEKGFPLSQVTHSRLKSTQKAIQQFPTTAAIFLDSGGEPWPAGHFLIQRDLANTYRQLAKEGTDYFYRGQFAKALDDWMQANGGILSMADMAGYKLREREAVYSEYRGYHVIGFPPPSSGGVHVAQILNMLANYDIARLSTDERYHLLLEAMKLAFADRAHYLGDPDFTAVPKGLVAQQYADRLAKGISLQKANQSVSHGVPADVDTNTFGKHTTHITAADKWGNWVSLTTTLNTSFGSKVVIPGTGVLMNNQMDDFASQPNVPNAYGLVGSEANSIQSGKRPLSSMSPTIVLKAGKPVMAMGAAGGPTIISQVVQGLVNMIDLGMSVEQALAAPRVHHQWLPAVAMVEKTIPKAAQEALQAKGHKLYPRSFMGVSTAIRLMPNGQFEAAAEPRIVRQNKATPE